jgi:DNA-directed RNA polymerase alpha subunit
MNTVLFMQATPSLEQVVSDWFNAHPGILDVMEEVDVFIKTKKKCPVNVIIDGVDIPSAESLEGILCQSVDVLMRHLPMRLYRVRVKNTLNNACITTLKQLVQKTERDMLRYRDFGRSCLWQLENALKEIDPRLYLGMILPEEEG